MLSMFPQNSLRASLLFSSSDDLSCSSIWCSASRCFKHASRSPSPRKSFAEKLRSRGFVSSSVLSSLDGTWIPTPNIPWLRSSPTSSSVEGKSAGDGDRLPALRFIVLAGDELAVDICFLGVSCSRRVVPTEGFSTEETVTGTSRGMQTTGRV